MNGTSLMDMSTIIPIVLALLLFFGSVVSAINTVSKKNRQIDLVFSLVNVVDTLTQTGVITKENFKRSVGILRSSLPVNFYVCITDVNDDQYNNCILRADKTSTNVTKSPQDIISTLKTRSYLSFAFPVTYQVVDKNGIPFNEVKKVLVIVWQGE